MDVTEPGRDAVEAWIRAAVRWLAADAHDVRKRPFADDPASKQETDMSETRSRAVHWRCFHCGDTFTRAEERWARKHFGGDESAEPVCLIRSAGEAALLTALRNAEDALARYRAEDTDLMRGMWAMQADHATALRREEERGYEKGMRDALIEPAAKLAR